MQGIQPSLAVSVLDSIMVYVAFTTPTPALGHEICQLCAPTARAAHGPGAIAERVRHHLGLVRCYSSTVVTSFVSTGTLCQC